MLEKTYILAASLAMAAAAYADAQPVVPENVPEPVTVLVEIPDMPALFERASAVMVQMAPEAVAMMPTMRPMVIQGMCRTNAPESVDLERPVRFVRLTPPLHKEQVTLFGLADADAYLQGVQLQERDVVGNLYRFGTEDAPFNVGVAADYAAGGGNEQAVRQVTELLTAGKLGDAPLLGDGDLAVAVRLKDLLAGLRETGEDPFKKGRQKLEGKAGPDDGAGSSEVRRQLVMLDVTEWLADQVHDALVRVWINPEAIVAAATARPVKDGQLARSLAEAPRQPLALVKYVPADAIFLAAAWTGGPKGLPDWYARILPALHPAGQEGLVKFWQECAATMAREAGREVACMVRVREGAGACMAVAFAADNAETARALAAGWPERVAAFVTAAEQAGVVKPDLVARTVVRHGDVPIVQLTTPWQAFPDRRAEEDPDGIERRRDLARKAFGEQALICAAVAQDAVLVTFGVDALAEMKAMMDGRDRLEAGRLQDLLRTEAERPVLQGFVSSAAFGNWMREMAPLMEPGDARAWQGPPYEPAGPIGFSAAVSRDGALTGQVVVPVDVLVSMAHRQRARRAEAPAPAPRRPDDVDAPPDAL